MLEATHFSKKLPEDNSDETAIKEGIAIHTDVDQLAEQFVRAIKMHRFWQREMPGKVPA